MAKKLLYIDIGGYVMAAKINKIQYFDSIVYTKCKQNFE
jgi:hypothetical protein